MLTFKKGVLNKLLLHHVHVQHASKQFEMFNMNCVWTLVVKNQLWYYPKVIHYDHFYDNHFMLSLCPILNGVI